jgi:hypothetical protein
LWPFSERAGPVFPILGSWRRESPQCLSGRDGFGVAGLVIDMPAGEPVPPNLVRGA